MTNYRDLIGLPYRVGARGPSEYDCAGVVLEWMRRAGFDGVTFEPGRWERLGSSIADARKLGDVAHTITPTGEHGVAVLIDTAPHLWLTALSGQGVVAVRSRVISAQLDAVYRWPE